MILFKLIIKINLYQTSSLKFKKIFITINFTINFTIKPSKVRILRY